MSTNETPLHIQQAEGLRALADMLEQNPELAQHLRYTDIVAINIPVSNLDNPVPVIAGFSRAALATGGEVAKDYAGDWAGVNLSWGPIGLHVYARREQVCERVVTGTETVTRTVKDPAALAEVPEVEVTEEVEIVKWECKPLLAAEASR